jgi:hypothetical protein
MRRDRCESLDGRVTWIYHVAKVYPEKEGYLQEGPALRYTEKMLRHVPGVTWAERPVRGKVAD